MKSLGVSNMCAKTSKVVVPVFGQKHVNRVVKVLAMSNDRVLVAEFVQMFMKDNPKFNYEKFWTQYEALHGGD